MKPRLLPCRSGDPADDRANRSLRAYAATVGTVVVLLLFASLLVLGGNPARDLATLLRLHGAPPNPTQFWGTAEAHVSSADGLCDVQSQHYRSGKGGGWKEEARASFIHGSPLLTLSDGREVALGKGRFEPYEGGELLDDLDGHRDAHYRERNPAFRGPLLYEQCMLAGTVYVDGCVHEDPEGGPPRLERCSSRPLALTQGNGGARKAEHARPVAYSSAALVVLLGVAIWMLVARLRGRSAESGLTFIMDGAKAPKHDPLWRRSLPLLLVPSALFSLCAGTVLPFGIAILGSAALIPSVMAVAARQRRAAIARWKASIEERPTSSLAGAQGDLVELSVHIGQDAPIAPAPLSGALVAHASIQVWERVVRRNGKNTSVEFEYVLENTPIGNELPVHDSSGRGTLALDDAIHDFGAVQQLADITELPPAVRALIARAYGTFLVREATLRRGDPLFAMGPVQRVADPHAPDQFAYRAAPTRAHVAPSLHFGEEYVPLFVHAGTERSLLDMLSSGMQRERAAILAGWGLTALAYVGVLFLALACWR